MILVDSMILKNGKMIIKQIAFTHLNALTVYQKMENNCLYFSIK